MDSEQRILLYAHDVYGIGPMHRALALAQQFARDVPRVSQLLLTGSPQSLCFDWPARFDYLKLPAVKEGATGAYAADALALPFETLLALREAMIFEAVRHFEPDVVLVDRAPAGMRGEMLRALGYLKDKRPQTTLVLGMRDIEDDAVVVRTEWRRHGIYALLDQVYDVVLLFGARAIYDPVSAYDLSPQAAARLTACGYIRREDALRPRDQMRSALDMQTDRLVVLTAGCGGESFDLGCTYVRMLDQVCRRGPVPFDSLVIIGPLLGAARHTLLHSLASHALALTVREFTPDLFDYLHAADLIVSMGGYDAICAILSLNQRAIVVPRLKPRSEQLIRAERFAAKGLLCMIHPNDLTPARLFEEIMAALGSTRPPRPEEVGVDMNGAVNASRVMAQLLGREKGTGASLAV